MVQIFDLPERGPGVLVFAETREEADSLYREYMNGLPAEEREKWEPTYRAGLNFLVISGPSGSLFVTAMARWTSEDFQSLLKTARPVAG
jgi:hypothetical protein